MLRRRQFLHGIEEEGSGLPDVWWSRSDGRRMTQTDWEHRDGHVLGMFLNGEEIAAPDARGRRVVDDSFLVLFNGHHEEMEFTLPPARFGATWTCELRTDDPARDGDEAWAAGAAMPVLARSIVLLRRTRA